MDLEGFLRRELGKKREESEILTDLVDQIMGVRDIDEEKAKKLAKATLEEVKLTQKEIKDDFIENLLRYSRSGIKMGEFGVGSRGEGDFFVHRKIGRLASNVGGFLMPDAQDDAGGVEIKDGVVIVAVDGTHSRLSEYPFLAGFHVARAALRDVYVNGTKPIALFDDVHLADDGDIGKLFDFISGITAVSELTSVPLIAGSTLRIGGDMVWGDRMVSGVGAVGVTDSKGKVTARRRIKPKDKILMTRGAGGGTICTAAIYSGNFDVVKETINIDFINACDAIFRAELLENIHSMADVTNGGLRGDANEICKTAGCGLILDEDRIKNLVNEKVYNLLNKLEIDYLGVSLDSLLIFAPPGYADELTCVVKKAGVEIDIIGEVVEKPKHGILMRNGKKENLTPRFRESGYTKIKKLIGEETPINLEEMKEGVINAFEMAVEKRDEIVRYIRDKG